MKVKKIISLTLAICFIASALLFAAGCNLFKTKIDRGTLAAKLLLANERLDENLLGGKLDIGLPTASSGLKSPKRSSVIATSAVLPTTATDTEGFTYTSFPDYSSSMVEFYQFLTDVEKDIEYIAENIAHMKNNVGITDKWVRVGRDLHMLRVYDTYDMLLVKSGEDTHVYYRYTDENARNIYETYSFTKYDDGTTGEIKSMLIPGLRYEYMYINSNGFEDYFIADNSRGYWMNTRFSYAEAYNSGSFSPYIIKDGLGYGSFLTVDSGLDNAWYSIFDPASNRELFRISELGSSYTFNLYFDAIKDGFVSTSTENAYHDEEYGVYQTSKLDTLNTKNGTYKAQDYDDLPDNAFGLGGGYVQYLYGEDIYYGSLEFVMKNKEMSIADACDEFESYATSLGLTLHCDMDAVAASIKHASILAENFGDSFEWNGYKMSNIDNLGSARDVLKGQFDSARAAYEEVKDYETVDSNQMLADSAHFAPIAVVSNGENSFSGKIISLSGISVSLIDTALLEVGEEYVIKVALSLLDEDGSPISVNTVPLPDASTGGVVYESGVITLSASGEYEIRTNLDRGQYAAVVYVATKDDGIRVSELKKIAFVDIEGGEIESSAMQLEATELDENLVLKYEIKNTRYINFVATKDIYTYDEIEKIINLEIVTYGLSYRDAVLEAEDGTPIATDAELGRGTYRLMCYLPTGDGLAQSYIYLVLE